MTLGFRLTVYPLLWLISMMPFPFMYVFSTFISFLLYRIIGYRKKIVRINLANSFPEKSDKERLAIEKAFYKHLADLMLETIKGMTISAKTLLSRMYLDNPEVFEKLNNDKRSSIIVMSHCGNWEWVCDAAQISAPQQAQCVYKTLTNKNWDAWFFFVRSRFGTQAFPMEKILRAMIDNSHLVTATAFIGDQNPSSGKNAWWGNFLNQDTCFMMGSEKIARKLDHSVYYLEVRKRKRGYYNAHLKLLCSNPTETHDGDITELIVRATEQDIKEQPETWLWSHRRWKHKRPAS